MIVEEVEKVKSLRIAFKETGMWVEKLEWNVSKFKKRCINPLSLSDTYYVEEGKKDEELWSGD